MHGTHKQLVYANRRALEKPHPCGFLFVSIVAKFTPGVKTDCTYFAGQCRIFLHTILNTGHVYTFRYRIQPFLRQDFFNFCVGCTDLQCNFIYPLRQSPGDCCDLFFGVLIAYDSHTIIISFALLYFCIQLIRIRRNDQ